MAEIAVPGHHHRYSQSIVSMTSTSALAGSPSDFEMVPNPDFVFPRTPPPPVPQVKESAGLLGLTSRPASMYTQSSQTRPSSEGNKHRRTKSTLPAFNFNAEDASGLKPDSGPSPPSTPKDSALLSDTAAIAPSRHVRNNSEFVGGDSRFGVGEAVHNSPGKATALPIPTGRSKHRRGQSVALSHHDLGNIIAPSDSPRLSSSLPTTPLEQPLGLPVIDDEATKESSQRQASLPTTASSDRPPSSRREVAFSPNIEIIPRPLSTISSETESSISTVRGHSVNNSISSVLSMGMPSPASARVRSPSLEVMQEDEPSVGPRSSLEISKRLEKEGEWLKSGKVADDCPLPMTRSEAPVQKLAFVQGEQILRSRPVHKTKPSLSHALGFDRRKSEPLIGMHIDQPSRLSAISLQDSALSPYTSHQDNTFRSSDNRSSTRKLKDWALSKLSWRQREHSRTQSEHGPILPTKSDVSMKKVVPSLIPTSIAPVAETDLDAVFASQAPSAQTRAEAARPHSMFEMNTPTPSQHSSSYMDASPDEPGTMLDLDAALGPFQTPPLGSQRHRRELHSSRLTRDFNGPGGHYLPTPSHRRAESAPMLTAFDMSRVSTPPQASMADVFEEDEEDDQPGPTGVQSKSGSSTQEDDFGIGIEVVDADPSPNGDPALRSCRGVRTQTDTWEMERPLTSYGSQGSRLSTPIIERRPSSILEDTIEEEPSQVETLEIVGDYEEPRAPSFAKSSDSSDTPTLLAPPHELLPLSDGTQPFMTPDTMQTSVFSSPDFTRRQTSFDTSRVGTSASSVTDNRTLHSYSGGDPAHDYRASVDDVPSLTSSRSTMMTHGNVSKRDVHEYRTPSAHSNTVNRTISAEQRRKRLSIQSLSNFVGGPFGSKTNLTPARPQTSAEAGSTPLPKKKEANKFKKLMFWRSAAKHRQANSSA